MRLPLNTNSIDIDTYGFPLDVYRAITSLNQKKDPMYCYQKTAHRDQIPGNGFCIDDSLPDGRVTFEFCTQDTANRMANFLTSVFGSDSIKKLDMYSKVDNWSCKFYLLVKNDQIVKKDNPDKILNHPDVLPSPSTTTTTTTNTLLSLEEKEKREKETFLKGIRAILAGILPMEELEKQRILKKYNGIVDAAEILISDVSIMNKALYLLERQGYHVTMLGSILIASKNEDLINAIPHHAPIIGELNKCITWCGNIQKLFERENINAAILSHPLYLVRNNYTVELEIQADNLFGARLITQILDGNKIPYVKRGRMLYVKMTSTIIKKALVEVIVKHESFKAENESFVNQTFDYDMFHFLPFNRDRDKNHIEWIAQSMDEFGIIDIVKIAYTDCVDGEYKYWIVDGQHTYSAARKRNLPVWYVVIQVDSLEELVRLTAVLNNRRKLWKFKDYLRAWSEIKVPVYQKIVHWFNQKLSFTVIIEAISGKNRRQANPLFQDGVFTEDPTLNSDQILANMLELKPYLPKGQTVSSAILRFMWTRKDYNNIVMQQVLKLSKQRGDILYEQGESIASVVKNIESLYDKQVR